MGDTLAATLGFGAVVVKPGDEQPWDDEGAWFYEDMDSWAASLYGCTASSSYEEMFAAMPDGITLSLFSWSDEMGTIAFCGDTVDGDDDGVMTFDPTALVRPSDEQLATFADFSRRAGISVPPSWIFTYSFW